MTNKLVQNFILYKLSKTRTTNVLPTASYLESVDADIKDSHGDLFEMTARTLQNVAVKMESRYSDFFEITIRTMTCNLDDVMEFSQSYSAIVRGMFSGNVINWERIAVLFTFSGQLAIYCEKQQRSPIYADIIILLLAQFVNTENTELFKWIQNAGGWVSLVIYMVCKKRISRFEYKFKKQKHSLWACYPSSFQTTVNLLILSNRESC